MFVVLGCGTAGVTCLNNGQCQSPSSVCTCQSGFIGNTCAKRRIIIFYENW